MESEHTKNQQKSAQKYLWQHKRRQTHKAVVQILLNWKDDLVEFLFHVLETCIGIENRQNIAISKEMVVAKPLFHDFKMSLNLSFL